MRPLREVPATLRPAPPVVNDTCVTMLRTVRLLTSLGPRRADVIGSFATTMSSEPGRIILHV